MYKRRAIALVISIFFIMAITVTIGVGLAQSNKAIKEVERQNFMLQTKVILDDVLNILQNSLELDTIVKNKSVDSLHLLLSEAQTIPFESSGISIVIKLSSARDKFNVNSLVNVNDKNNIQRINALSAYMGTYDVNNEYINILLDNMSKIKEDISYNSGIFDERPYLFRDYIVSLSHLEEINAFYTNTYHDNSLSKIEFEKLFDFSEDRLAKIDLNYATIETWRLLLACDEFRAEQLSIGGGSYKKLVDLDLNDDEEILLNSFSVSYFEPILNINMKIISGTQNAEINFEYDMKAKKGGAFVYEI